MYFKELIQIDSASHVFASANKQSKTKRITDLKLQTSKSESRTSWPHEYKQF
jgi:hypothetical protein